MKLEGKTAVITGGSKGIGHGISEAFAAQSMNILISARNKDEATKAVQEIIFKIELSE